MTQHRRFARSSCASPRQRIASAWRVVPLLLACLALGFAAAQSVSQEAALGFRDPRLIDLEARLADALQKVETPSGFGYSAIARPRVSVTNRLDLEDGPSWSHGIGAVGAVTYRYDPVALVREVRDLERALFDVDTAQRDGVLQALRAHVTWWNQTRALATAQTRATTAQADLSDAEAAFERGDIDRFRLAELQLAADRADLALREATFRFDDARRSAATFGLRGTPAYQPLRFALPEPDLGRLFGVRSLQVALDEAEAAQLQAELFRLPKEVRLTASYATERITVGTEMGMFNRVPGAEVTLGYPGAANPNWTIGLRAEIVIDDALFAAIDSASERVERAEQALTDYLADYPDQVASARQLVVFAEENLTYAERALDLDERRVGDLEARLADTRARLAATDADDAERAEEIANLERDLAALERDLDRALTTLERSEGALLNTWNAYLGQVYTYLRLVQGSWEVR